jgi:putative oxidoreductase
MSLHHDITSKNHNQRCPASVILIRIVVGAVFLSEGIHKFLFPNDLGVGRFIKIGIPAPEIMGPFVGVVEIVCGSLIILGLLTRLAPLLSLLIYVSPLFLRNFRFSWANNAL